MKSLLVVMALVVVASVEGFTKPRYPLPYCQAPLSVGENPWMATHVRSPESRGLSEDAELALVQIVVRHGDRTPVVGIPGDETVWLCSLNALNRVGEGASVSTEIDGRLFRTVQMYGRDKLAGNCSLGQLTTLGHWQHEQIGANFRELYHDAYGFFPSDYDPEEVWVRAIDIQRCRQSAQSELQTMFPAGKASCTHGEQLVTAIPVHTMGAPTENMSPNFANCPAMLTRVQAMQQTPEWAQFEEDTAELTQTMLKMFNLSSASEVGSVMYPFYIGIYDTLAADNCHDLPMPQGMTQEIFDQVVQAGTWTVNHWLFNETMAQLAIGTFFSELSEAMETVVNGGASPKLRFYGGQDLTIGPLLNALGVYKGVWPPYAAHLTLELWKSSGDFLVRVLYNGEELVIPGCEAFCPYTTFYTLTKHMLLSPQEYAAQCADTSLDPAFVRHLRMPWQ